MRDTVLARGRNKLMRFLDRSFHNAGGKNLKGRSSDCTLDTVTVSDLSTVSPANDFLCPAFEEPQENNTDLTEVSHHSEESEGFSTFDNEARQRKHHCVAKRTTTTTADENEGPAIRRRSASFDAAPALADLSENSEGSAMSYRIEDYFARDLNRCEASAIPELRRYRADVNPIVICEEDSDDEEDPAMKARLQALEIQQGLLGEDHPDVKFMLQSISRLNNHKSSTMVSRHLLSTSPSMTFKAPSAHQFY